MERSELLRRIKLGLTQVDALLDEIDKARSAGRKRVEVEAIRKGIVAVDRLVSDTRRLCAESDDVPQMFITYFQLLNARLLHVARKHEN